MSGVSAANTLEALERDWPGWVPWLSVVQETLAEAAGTEWDRFVPDRAASATAGMPLLVGAPLTLDEHVIGDWVNRLFRAATREGRSPLATLSGAAHQLDPVALFAAALWQDAERLAEDGARGGADPDAFQAVASLVPVPFLQACGRRLGGAVPSTWAEGYCPVCGAWPAFAELVGTDRTRRLRCGRCGTGWPSQPLCCPYCEESDHERLVTLVPTAEEGSTSGTVEACQKCRGYVKVLPSLVECPPGAVMLQDLASVALDLAALEQDYRRPAGAGRAPEPI